MRGGEPTGLQFDEEERLPWLEAGEQMGRPGVPYGRIVKTLLVVLLVVALAGTGVWWLRYRVSFGHGEVIAAPAGPVRVAPPAERGRFDGEGNASVAAAEGVRPNGRVDPNQLPEAPVAPPTVAARSTSLPVGSTAVGTGETSTAVPSVATAPRGSSGTVQIGSFTTDTAANRAWASMKERFPWLEGVGAGVASEKVNDRTVYHLRIATGANANARSLCNRFRVAGENCIIL